MKILALDPGPVQSAWLVYDSQARRLGSFAKEDNDRILGNMQMGNWQPYCDVLVIEQVQSFGMSVGASIFETVFWSGRFAEAWGAPFDRIGRIAIKNHLCHSSRAKDANIRAALIDRFGPPGTKAAPGATYGVSKDIWSCLAIAATYGDLHS